MSSTVIDRARPAGHRAPHRGSGFTGTLGLLRLYLRRDRVSLPLWVLLLSVPLATVYIASVETVYPDRSARADPKCLVSPRISMGTWWLSADMCFSLLSFGQEGLVHGAVGQQAFGVDLQGRQHHVVRVVA